MKLTRIAAAAALLFASSSALADPFSIAALVTAAATTATGAAILGFALTAGQAFLINLGISLLATADARRKARKAAARQRAAYNASLTERSVTVASALPPRRTIYGRPGPVGGDVLAVFTSDKTAYRADGSSYTIYDALKHIVIHYASHQCQAINDIIIDGVSVGTLDGSGYPTGGAFVTAETTTRQITYTTSATLPDPVATVLAHGTDNGFSTETDPAWTDATYTLTGGNTIITDTSGAGGVRTFSYTVAKTPASVRIQKHLGTAAQTVDTYLNSVAPSQWTSNHRLRGLTYIVLTLDLTDPRFQGGPPNALADISGKLLFDGRTDTTAYSENPALCVRDHLRSVTGYDVDDTLDIDDAMANTTATACDVAISLTTNVGGSPVTVSAPKYTCNGAFTTNDSPEAVLEELVEAMAGDITYGARWVMSAGVWVAPVMDLDEDDLHGQIEILQCGAGLDELFNGVRASYIAALTSTPTDVDPPYRNATFAAADGEDLWVDAAYPFTSNATRCNNLSRIKTERARAAMTVLFPAKLGAFRLQVGDRVTVTSAEYGWTAKTFIVTDWAFSLTSAVLLTLKEDTEDIYDLADAANADPTPNTNLPNADSVATVSGLAAASGAAHALLQADGTSTTRVYVSWTAVTDAYVADGAGHIEVRWHGHANTTWVTQRAAGRDTGTYIVGARNGDRLTIEVRAVNGLDRRSNAAVLMHVVVGTDRQLELLGIGGGNLLPNSAFRPDLVGTWADNWGVYNNAAIATTRQVLTGGMFGANYLEIQADAAGATTLGVYTTTAITGGGVKTWVPGQQYMISFWARAGNAGAVGQLMDGLLSNMGWTESAAVVAPTLSTDWQRWVYRVKPASNGSTPAGELYLSRSTSGPALPSGAKLHFGALQVEIGSLVTNWSANATNFEARNDRSAAAIVAPTIAADGTAVDHTLPGDGSADISLEWSWSGNNADIDGWIVTLRQSTSSSAYTIGTTAAEEQTRIISADKRAHFWYGVAADRYYTFGVQAYRVVDQDVAASGLVKSTAVQPALGAEAPYRPASSIAFTGDVTGTVGGTPVANVTRVYLQTTAPSGTGHKVNDEWYDTDNGHAHYLWDGAAWTLATTGTGALADNAATDTSSVSVDSDVYNFPAAVGTQDRNFTAINYTNTQSVAVIVEVTATGDRSYTTSALQMGSASMVCWISVLNVTDSILQPDLPVNAPKQIPAQAAGVTARFTEAVSAGVSVPAGKQYSFTPKARSITLAGSVDVPSLTTTGYSLRIAAVKK